MNLIILRDLQMERQFETIQEAYDAMMDSGSGRLELECESELLRQVILPNSRILEMGCGSGAVTQILLNLPAAHVLAVDSSPAMVQAARRRIGHRAVKFLVADCRDGEVYEGAPFDHVVAAWLLDFAPDKETMEKMLRTAAVNLRSGATFVGIVNPPTHDPRSQLREELRVRPPHARSDGCFPDDVQDVAHGIAVQRIFYSQAAGETSLTNYYLRKSVYESAARGAGLDGRLEWIMQKVPDDLVTGRRTIPDVDIKEMLTYEEVPEHAFLVIAKL